MTQKRKSRFSHEQASQRVKSLYVHPDGTPMTKEQIAFRRMMAKLKQHTTR